MVLKTYDAKDCVEEGNHLNIYAFLMIALVWNNARVLFTSRGSQMPNSFENQTSQYTTGPFSV